MKLEPQELAIKLKKGLISKSNKMLLNILPFYLARHRLHRPVFVLLTYNNFNILLVTYPEQALLELAGTLVAILLFSVAFLFRQLHRQNEHFKLKIRSRINYVPLYRAPAATRTGVTQVATNMKHCPATPSLVVLMLQFAHENMKFM